MKGLRVPYIGYCEEHGKKLFTPRSSAKKAIRVLGGGMREYRCDVRDGWHIGHLPQAVVAGVKTVAEVYRKPRGSASPALHSPEPPSPVVPATPNEGDSR